jgi:Endonuclease NucS
MSDGLTNEKRSSVIALIREGRTGPEISAATGLSEGTIKAIRANDTMGRYAPPEEIEAVDEAFKTTFGLERDLQDALRSNIEQLEPGLKIVDGGKEQIVPSGRIDITAKDKRGAMVVIELKAGEADRDAVGQLLSYMGDMVSDSSTPVRGILVARGFSTRAISAARATGNVELKRYTFRFMFESANVPATQSGLL